MATSPDTINILLTSFPGLNLPSTLCIPVPSSSTISDLTSLLSARVGNTTALSNHRLILTTSSNKAYSLTSTQPLRSLLQPRSSQSSDSASDAPSILPLRLSAPLCGGKGGFGSQLRAAGGRMSSRKKRSNDPAAAHASSRNLDGRRLRTVTEAKALAEYLAVKPEMEKKEKEERRKRWEAVVEAAERQTEEVKEGKGKARVDGKWAEEKEEQEGKMREAVVRSVRAGMLPRVVVGGLTEEQKVVLGVEGVEVLKDGGESAESDEMEEDEEDSGDEDAGEGSSSSATTPPSGSERKIFGWDDEDDDDDDEEDET